mmetsp:Transcript_4391/g.9752  ORF Transcript_4391/g.9752 Transcript_4391/m.9752 type:complete len:272 (+) Transcript_4391:784-1599(+)
MSRHTGTEEAASPAKPREAKQRAVTTTITGAREARPKEVSTLARARAVRRRAEATTMTVGMRMTGSPPFRPGMTTDGSHLCLESGKSPFVRVDTRVIPRVERPRAAACFRIGVTTMVHGLRQKVAAIAVNLAKRRGLEATASQERPRDACSRPATASLGAFATMMTGHPRLLSGARRQQTTRTTMARGDQDGDGTGALSLVHQLLSQRRNPPPLIQPRSQLAVRNAASTSTQAHAPTSFNVDRKSTASTQAPQATRASFLAACIIKGNSVV